MPPGDIIRTPRLLTRCLISATMFEAAPNPSAPATERGLLRLADQVGSRPKYALTQIDAQGGAQILINDILNRTRSLIVSRDDPFLPSPRPRHP